MRINVQIIVIKQMARRYQHDKNKSQIVFDFTGGEREMRTMTMQTIPKAKNIVRSEGQNFSLRTDDIQGARPSPPKKAKQYDFYNPDDIDGSKSKPNVDITKKPKDIMSVDDIQGASPSIQRSLPHSNRHSNPQNPVYDLPSYKEEPIPVPKFIRDNINYDDIPGVHPKSYKTNKPPKDTLKIDDIPGAAPKHLVGKFIDHREMDVSDINNDGIFKTRRETNPLFPDYYYDGQTYPRDFGIQKSNYKTRNKDTDLSLRTSDIPGACADSSTEHIRNFKAPPPPSEEDEFGKPVALLNLPSMKKAEKELEKRRAIEKYHGETIRRFENRHLAVVNQSADPAQAALKNQRQGRRAPATFQVSDADYLK